MPDKSPGREIPEIILKAIRGELTARELVQIGLAEDTKRAIKRAIEVNPAMEEAILNISELSYRDGSLFDTEILAKVFKLYEPEPEPEPDDTRCNTCGERHTIDRAVIINRANQYKFTFWPGHEYVLVTKLSYQRRERSWRMGFLGRSAVDSGDLQFSARGPDRTHEGQYGGTVQIRADSINGAREVEHVPAARYTGVLA